jgi:RHS repeat-associated protein
METYDAAGTTLVKAYDYLAGIVYQETVVASVSTKTLDFIASPEGRAIPKAKVNPADVATTGDQMKFEYSLKDHLGNLRVSCRCGEPKRDAQGVIIPTGQPGAGIDAVAVVQEQHYDAWGLAFTNPATPPPGAGGADKFTYNGKELVSDLDLGWNDYRARMYDASIGRWSAVDPLADIDTYNSIYCFNYNNSLRFIDPNGMLPGDYYNEKGEKIGHDEYDDKKVYQTTNDIYYNYVTGLIGEDQNGPDYEGLRNNSNTHYLGEMNEFGLIQLTKMGNFSIGNYGNEDIYSYVGKSGKTMKKGSYGDDWAKPGTAAAFYAAVNEFTDLPGNYKLVIKVNDASAFNPSKDLDHQTHFEGKSIDMPFLKTNGTHSNNIFNLTKSDIVLNGIFVNILKQKGFTKNYSDKGKIPNTVHSGGHDDHLHVGTN